MFDNEDDDLLFLTNIHEGMLSKGGVSNLFTGVSE